MEEKRFSYSKILDYAFCPKKYYYRNICHIAPVGKAKALSMGGCMSSGLQTYRETGDLNRAVQAFIDTWERDGKVLKYDSDPDDPKDFRTVMRGLDILTGYAEKYPDDPSETIQPEVSFELDEGEMLGRKILITGRIDGVISDGLGGARINEDKTTSRLGPKFFDPLRGSLQIGLYLYAGDRYGLFDIGKRTTPSCIMNAIYINSKELRYKRDIVVRSRKTLQKYRDNAMSWIRQILIAEDSNLFPLNDVDNSMCTKYGGCDYLPLKYAGGTVRQSLLKNGYCAREKVDDRYVSRPLTDEEIGNV